MCLGALQGEHSLKVARNARAVQGFPLGVPKLRLFLLYAHSLGTVQAKITQGKYYPNKILPKKNYPKIKVVFVIVVSPRFLGPKIPRGFRDPYGEMCPLSNPCSTFSRSFMVKRHNTLVSVVL